jgi:hypothetical protein
MRLKMVFAELRSEHDGVTAIRSAASSRLISLITVRRTLVLKKPSQFLIFSFFFRGESASVRSPAAYVAGGALTGLLIFACAWAFSTLMTGRAGTATTTIDLLGNIALVTLMPGACGGLAYWAVAGRWAGSGFVSSAAAQG